MSGRLPARSRALLLAAAVLAAGGEARPGGASGAAPLLPSPAELEAAGARIGEITIRVDDVFDPAVPAENRAVYRAANRLHYTTRPGVIRSQLLFDTGDRYSERLIRETERLLRGSRYLFDCAIRPVRYLGNVVDLEVWVKDVWTLKAGLSASRSGGVNSTKAQVQDLNLLGSGSQVTLRYKTSVDRDSLTARYIDQNVLGSRVRVSFVYSDDSDGDRVRLVAGRPFFSLDSRWAAGMDGESADRIDQLYSLGKIAGEFRHRRQRFELDGGLSGGLKEGRTRRWRFGLAYQDHRFESLPGADLRGLLPEDRRLVYPWVGIESVSDAWLTARDFDQLGRTEDLRLGLRASARLGFAAEALGSSRDLAVLEASAEGGWRPSGSHTLLAGGSAAGRWGREGPENLRLLAELRYYWRNLGRHQFFVGLEAGLARNPDLEEQLLLGGDSGLRGYPLRYQDGRARMLLTLEQRFYSEIDLWRVFTLGAAVFVDLGRTWSETESLSPNLGLLKNVGVGLRLGSTRSGLGSVVHFDLAFPLDGDPSIDSIQWLVTTRDTL